MKRGTLIEAQHFLGTEFALFGHCSMGEAVETLGESLPPVSHLEPRWGMWVRLGSDPWSLVSQTAYARGLFPITLVCEGEEAELPLDLAKYFRESKFYRLRLYGYATCRKPQRPND
jgi:hypothetical protein